MRDQARQNPQMTTYLNSPEFRRAVLDDVIERRLLLGNAAASGMTVSVDELRNVISDVQAFYGEDGKFSVARYEQLCARKISRQPLSRIRLNRISY